MGQAGQFSYGVKTGEPIRISYDGFPEYKAGGITIDWSTVAAVSAATTLEDGTVVEAGDRFLRYGTVMGQINAAAEVQTVDLSGADDPNGGTWTLTVGGTNSVPIQTDDGVGGSVVSYVDTHTTAPLAYNASAAAVQASLDALDNVEAGSIVVTKTGFVYTLTYAGRLGDAPAVTANNLNLTTAASTITIAVTTTTPGSASGGKYGPVDTTASDGRQTPTRGLLAILNETVVQSEPMSDHAGGPVTGGKVFARRLNVGGTNQITLANLLAALPRLEPVYE